MSREPIINLHLGDCMEAMKGMRDKQYDLAIVDPPYGIGVAAGRAFGDPLRKDGSIRHGIDKRNGATIVRKPSKYKKKNWDINHMNEEYFYQLRRVSKNQIVWGANHFISKMPIDSSCWIVWDKINGTNDFADAELALTSFGTSVRIFKYMWNGFLQGSERNGEILEGNIRNREKRIHPTQKPVKLYKWLIENYAKEGDKILDTHGGSFSIAIACYEMGFDLDLWEIDKDYYEASARRFNDHKKQLKLFRA